MPSPSPSPSPALVIGAVAYDPKVVTIWELIREFFAGRGLPIDYRLFSNYEAQVEALLARHIDVAWNTNVAWLRLQRRTEGRARAVAMRNTDVGFTSKMIARADLPVAKLADLRGKTIALGSADSGQAAILPVHFLKQEGLIEGTDYKSLRFNLDVGKHGDTGSSELEVLAAIADGRADAGPVGDTTWANLLAARAVDTAKVRAVWTSPPYAHCNFSVLGDFPADRADDFRTALLSMQYGDASVRRLMDLEGLKEWVVGRTDGYAVLEAAMKDQHLL